MQNTVANDFTGFMSLIFQNDPLSEAQFYPIKKPKLEISKSVKVKQLLSGYGFEPRSVW